MIRIHRPTKIPKILRTQGQTATRTLLAQYKADPSIEMVIDAKIYGDPSVKDALRIAQHGKCAFCESLVAHISPGDIEHFRPKKGYRQDVDDDTLRTPGYFWLAYSWKNLLFACEECNRRHKKNWFPLANPKQRATPKGRSLKPEQPLFIDPSALEPRNHITFREHIAVAVNDDITGRTTIEGLGLNRSGPEPKGLLERRRDSFISLTKDWQMFRNLEILLTKKPSSELVENRTILRDRFTANHQPTAEYSAMARDYLLAVGFLPNPDAA
jgi:uncharacterized protein (TIGR02646 family)